MSYCSRSTSFFGEVLPKYGELYDVDNASLVLCKPKIMPLKSVTLENIRKISVKGMDALKNQQRKLQAEMPPMPPKLLFISGQKLDHPSVAQKSFSHRKQNFSSSSKNAPAISFPPTKVGPTNKGVPVLWSQYPRKKTTGSAVNLTHQNSISKMATFLPSKSLMDGRCKSSQEHASTVYANIRNEINDKYFDDSSKHQIGSITLRHVLWPPKIEQFSTLPHFPSHRFHASKHYVPSTQEEFEHFASFLFPKKAWLSESDASKNLGNSAKVSRMTPYEILKYHSKLEFHDRHNANTDDLIEKGLLMTKEMLQKVFGRLPYSRHQSMPAANFDRPFTDEGLADALLASGSKVSMHKPSGTMSKRPKTSLPRKLQRYPSRCLSAKPEINHQRPCWKF